MHRSVCGRAVVTTIFPRDARLDWRTVTSGVDGTGLRRETNMRCLSRRLSAIDLGGCLDGVRSLWAEDLDLGGSKAGISSLESDASRGSDRNPGIPRR